MEKIIKVIRKTQSLFTLKTILFLGAIFAIFTTAAQGTIEHYKHPSLVVGVAQWRYEGGSLQNIQTPIYELLLERIGSLGLNNVEVIKIPTSLNNANDVDGIAEEYKVDVIVWGWYDETASRSFVDLANATQADGMTNSLGQFLENGGSTEVIRVLKVLSQFDYYEDGVFFCVPRWAP